MAVPANIREVPRPVNTVVVDQGGNTPKRYAVRGRKFVKYVRGGNPQPVSGAIVGYIIEGKFVPREVKLKPDLPDSLQWGAPALFKMYSEDIREDLLKVMDPKAAYQVLAMCALRIIHPRISNRRLQSQYDKSFLRVFYPGVKLGESTVTKLLTALGENDTLREKFYQERFNRVASSHHIVIDSTLIQDTSSVNDLSGFSYKARIKGCREISALYAYDVEKLEPICAQVFPGNQPDISICKEFLTTNHITKGILVADRGFNLKEIRRLQKENPDLHYLCAIKRNDSRLRELGLLTMKEVLPGEQKPILCAKAGTENGIWIYVFQDSKRAAIESQTYLSAAQKHKSFNPDDYEEKREKFGIIAFESDCDLSCETVYSTYQDRWQLELIFKQYKTGLEGNQTRVQGDYAVIGSEFVNFLCTIVTSRIVQAEKRSNVLEDASYGEVLDDLRSAWRKFPISEEKDLPSISDARWVHTTQEVKKLLLSLGLARDPDHPNPPKEQQSKDKTLESEPNKTEEPKEKKKPGRPRKNPPKDPDAPKPKLGRPRKNPAPDPNAPKKKPGRPRKNPASDPNAPKRKRGRPRKIVSSESVEESPQSVADSLKDVNGATGKL